MNDGIQCTHSEHCWAAGHYDCAVKKIAELEAEVERLLDLLERAGSCLHSCGLRDEVFAAIGAARGES